MGQLPIMFFIPGRVAQKRLAGDPRSACPAGFPSAVATLQPPPSPQGRQCSPLLAHPSGFARTLFAFACRATGNSMVGPVTLKSVCKRHVFFTPGRRSQTATTEKTAFADAASKIIVNAVDYPPKSRRPDVNPAFVVMRFIRTHRCAQKGDATNLGVVSEPRRKQNLSANPKRTPNLMPSYSKTNGINNSSKYFKKLFS